MLIAAISASAAIFIFSAVVACCNGRASQRDRVRNRVSEIGREVNRAYLLTDEELSKPLYERLVRPAIQRLVHGLASLVPIRNREHGSGDKQKKMLEQAGWSISVEEYIALQLTLMVSCGALGVMLGVFLEVDTLRLILYFFGGAFAAFTLLRYLCAAKVTARKTEMEKQLPDMLDLLSVSVEAGLGFERALLHVTETMDGPLIDEISVTYREMSMGRSRKEALSLLGERCGVEDIASFTGALVQAGQLGIPIRNVLQAQAEAIRRSRRSKVQEKAAKVSTKILLPMLIFIFPVLFIVLLGPSVLTIMEQF